MRRTDRLFELLLLFREGRLLTGHALAARLGVSVRTVYRDVQTLLASGVPIEGERGVGYVLREPLFLPPLTLTEDEAEALHFALEHAQRAGDAVLAPAVASLRAKLDAVLPTQRQGEHFARALVSFAPGAALPLLAPLRAAIRTQRRLHLTYTRLDGAVTERTVRPLRLEWWGRVWTLTAWCETRADFRVFRADRIASCVPGERFAPEAGTAYADYLARFPPAPG